MRSLGYRVFASAAVALVFASPAGAAAPSHAAFVAHANAICTKENAQARVLTAPTSQATTVSYLAKTVAILQRARTATLALPAPAADQPVIRAGMAAVAKEFTSFRKAKADVVANDPTSYQADVGDAKTAHDTWVTFAKKLGLKSCET